MSNLSRRNFLKTLGLAGGVVATSSFLPSLLANGGRVLAQDIGLAGTVLITLAGPIRIHTYIAPEASALVTSHIIETENNLIMVDSQFLEPYANELKTYIDGTGKPLERIYLSHQHQDHWSGAQVFDADFITTDAIATSVAEEIANGDGGFGTPRAPEGGVVGGTEIIDGVTFEFEIISDAEAPEQILIKLPEAGAVIAQDLMYNNAHFFPLGNNANWISTLEGLRPLVDDGYSLMFNGHGLPSSLGEIDEAIDYLNFQSETMANASTGQEAIDALIERYPSYGGLVLTSFVNFMF